MAGNGRGRGNGQGANGSRPALEYMLTGINKRPVAGYRNSIVKIKHGNKLLKRIKSQMSYADQQLYSSRQFAEGSNKYEEFFCYDTVEDEDSDKSYIGFEGAGQSERDSGSNLSDTGFLQPRAPRILDPKALLFQDVSLNVVDYLNQRNLGNLGVTSPQILQPRLMTTSYNVQNDFAIKHLLTNSILNEKAIKVENLNKVFCSQWLSDKQVILGTKCNKLIVLDVQKKDMTTIPSLAPSSRSLPPESQCGIHAIQINPGRSLLATGGKNPNDVAVYRLPTMDPVCVGELAHQDWVFGLAWIDDQYFVSGSRDTSLAVWSVADYYHEPSEPGEGPSHSYMRAITKKECKSAQKVRDVVFNRRLQEIACVSLNGYVHLWKIDSERFDQEYSRKLPFATENVCLAVHEDYGLYAVGSKSHTTLLDSRTIQCVKKIPSKYSGFGIRSANFYSTLLSIGTGQGTIMFYDLRAGKYLETHNNSARSATLKSSAGWTYLDEEIFMDVFRQRYTPAIYTHCFDMSGTRIFAAGGPLPITLAGNYIGLYH